MSPEHVSPRPHRRKRQRIGAPAPAWYGIEAHAPAISTAGGASTDLLHELATDFDPTSSLTPAVIPTLSLAPLCWITGNEDQHVIDEARQCDAYDVTVDVEATVEAIESDGWTGKVVAVADLTALAIEFVAEALVESPAEDSPRTCSPRTWNGSIDWRSVQTPIEGCGQLI